MSQYRATLSASNDDLETTIMRLTRVICDLQRELDNTMRDIPQQATLTADEAFEKVGECPFCTNLVLGAREELMNLNHYEDGFVKTRSLLELEDDFIRLWVEKGLLEDYEEVLLDALYEEEPHESEQSRDLDFVVFDTENVQEVVERDEDMLRIAKILLTFQSSDNPYYHASHYAPYKTLGYCKKCVIKTIRDYIARVGSHTSKSVKIQIVNKLFEYLSLEGPQKFLASHPKFAETVKSRLFYFRDEDNIKRAKVWWRLIFHERMPVDKP